MRRSVLVLFSILVLVLTACSQTSAPPKQAAPSAAPAPGSEGRLVPELTMYLPAPNYISTQYDSAAFIAKSWEKLGVKTKLVTHPDWATFVGMVDDRTKWDAAVQGFVANPSRMDPDEFVTRMFLSKYVGKGGTNYGEYKNSEYDKIAVAQREEMDPGKRLALVKQAQALIAKDVPAISVFHNKTISVYNKQKFSNVVSVPGVGLMNIYNYVQATPLTSDKTLVASYVGQMRAINPLNAPAWDVEQEFQRLVYDTLTRIGPKGTPEPWAAREWKVVDPKTVTATLRSGMKFHDGKPVTAEDVAFSYMFIKSQKVGSYNAALNSIESATAKGADAVEFKLSAAYAPLTTVTFSQVPILPKHIWDGVAEKNKLAKAADWDNAQMIGSGPFKFNSFKQNQEFIIDRNPDHWMAPKVDRLVNKMFTAAEARFLAMKKGEVHFHESKGLPPNQVEEAKTDPALGIVEDSGNDVRWMTFNLSRGPFQDYAFRAAMVNMVDYKTIQTDILKNQGVGGRGFVPPGNTAWHDTGVQYPQMDLEKARKILKDAGYEWDAQGRLLFPKDYKPALLAK